MDKNTVIDSTEQLQSNANILNKYVNHKCKTKYLWNIDSNIHIQNIRSWHRVKMSIAGGSDTEYILNQIKDIQNRDIPLEEKNELINSILKRK